MGRRAARERSAFADQRTVTVRCPSCRARLAEAWPKSSRPAGRGWDGIMFALVEDVDNFVAVPPQRWTCQRCGEQRTVRRADLHWQLSAAVGDRPEVMLGDGPPQQDEWWRTL